MPAQARPEGQPADVREDSPLDSTAVMSQMRDINTGERDTTHTACEMKLAIHLTGHAVGHQRVLILYISAHRRQTPENHGPCRDSAPRPRFSRFSNQLAVKHLRDCEDPVNLQESSRANENSFAILLGVIVPIGHARIALEHRVRPARSSRSRARSAHTGILPRARRRGGFGRPTAARGNCFTYLTMATRNMVVALPSGP